MATLSTEQRQAKITSYGKSYADFTEALEKMPREMWQFKPAPTDWSIHQVIVHLADSESNSMARFRRAVAEPGSSVFGYDQVAWAEKLDYHGKNPDIALRVLGAVRESVYELLQSLPESVFAHTIHHSVNGIMTLDDVLTVYEDHLPGHQRQIEAIYAAWQATQ